MGLESLREPLLLRHHDQMATSLKESDTKSHPVTRHQQTCRVDGQLRLRAQRILACQRGRDLSSWVQGILRVQSPQFCTEQFHFHHSSRRFQASSHGAQFRISANSRQRWRASAQFLSLSAQLVRSLVYQGS